MHTLVSLIAGLVFLCLPIAVAHLLDGLPVLLSMICWDETLPALQMQSHTEVHERDKLRSAGCRHGHITFSVSLESLAKG